MVLSSSCRCGAGVKTIRQSCNSSRVRNPAPLGCVSCLIFIYTWYIFLLYKYLYIFFYLGDFLFFFFKEHRVTNTRTRLLVLVSPPHQVRTAADTASEDDSCGHRRCWTAAASKGLLCLVCVVLVLVAVRFASWTMMAVIFF